MQQIPIAPAGGSKDGNRTEILSLSTSKLLSTLGWLSVNQILAFSANILMYKKFHLKKPKLMHYRLIKNRPPKSNNTRNSGPFKLGPRPSTVGKTLITRKQYRSKSYDFYEQVPEEIQKLSKIDHFKKWLNFFLQIWSNPTIGLPPKV